MLIFRHCSSYSTVECPCGWKGRRKWSSVSYPTNTNVVFYILGKQDWRKNGAGWSIPQTNRTSFQLPVWWKWKGKLKDASDTEFLLLLPRSLLLLLTMCLFYAIHLWGEGAEDLHSHWEFWTVFQFDYIFHPSCSILPPFSFPLLLFLSPPW